MSALYELSAARSPEQRGRMEALEAAGVCVFCRDHHVPRERPVVELEGRHWYVIESDFPYTGTVAHHLVIPHAHVAAFDDLPDEAGAELWAIRRELKERVDAPAVATVERSGDMRYNGASVAHLHVHVVALDRAPSRTVRFRVSARAHHGEAQV